MRHSAVGIGVAFFAVAGLLRQAAPPPVIGILENTPCKDSGSVAIRALFTKSGGSWSPIAGDGAVDRIIVDEVSWTVSLAGEALGSVRTIDPKRDTKFAWTKSTDPLLRLSPGQQAPRRADPSHQFGGWCAAIPNRPLVVENPSNFHDPDAWKRFDPPLSLRETLFPLFRNAAGEVVICPTNPAKDVAFDYTSRDVYIVSAYRNRAGQSIIALQFDTKKNGCAGPVGTEWEPHWFLLGNQPRPLGDGFQLLDAGDYDGDGKSELLFWYSGAGREGYTLFTDDLRKTFDVRWGSR